MKITLVFLFLGCFIALTNTHVIHRRKLAPHEAFFHARFMTLIVNQVNALQKCIRCSDMERQCMEKAIAHDMIFATKVMAGDLGIELRELVTEMFQTVDLSQASAGGEEEPAAVNRQSLKGFKTVDLPPASAGGKKVPAAVNIQSGKRELKLSIKITVIFIEDDDSEGFASHLRKTGQMNSVVQSMTNVWDHHTKASGVQLGAVMGNTSGILGSAAAAIAGGAFGGAANLAGGVAGGAANLAGGLTKTAAGVAGGLTNAATGAVGGIANAATGIAGGPAKTTTGLLGGLKLG